MQIGDQAALTKMIQEEDIQKFAEISSDYNPIHINEEFARNTRFGSRIAHGMLTGSLISGVLGSKLPGEGSILLSQTLRFIHPVYIHDLITAYVTITNILDKGDKVIVECKTVCRNQRNEMVIDGEAVLLKYPNWHCL